MTLDAKPTTCLVTGGAGFIGSRLVKRLHAAGWKVRVLDDLSSGTEARLLPLQGLGRFEFREGSIGDGAVLDECLSDADVVIHLAALVSVQVSIEQPAISFARNVAGAFAVFDAARRARRQPPVVYASSAAVYGATPGPITSEADPVQPLSPYAADKLYMEGLASAYHGAYGLASIGLRLFNVYGPGQSPTSPYSGVITKFTVALQSGGPATIFGDGEQTRDFVHVDDVCSALELAAHNLLRRPRSPATAAVCNVGSGQATSINQLHALLGRLTSHPLAPRRVAEVPGNVRHSCADIRLASTLLGWSPATSLADGLRDLVVTPRAPEAP